MNQDAFKRVVVKSIVDRSPQCSRAEGLRDFSVTAPR